jgi:hypothetical protein
MRLMLVIFLMALCSPTMAQTPVQAVPITSCGSPPAGAVVVGGGPVTAFMDANGKLCDSGGSASSPTSPSYTTVVGATTGGVVPVVSATTEGSHVCKTGAGTLYSAGLNVHGVSGYLEIWDATSAPADGAVTPGSGGLLDNILINVTNAAVSYVAIPMGYSFTSGLVLVFSSGSYTNQITSSSVEFRCLVK